MYTRSPIRPLFPRSQIISLIDDLLRLNAPPTAVAEEGGATCLIVASAAGLNDVLESLLKHGAQPIINQTGILQQGITWQYKVTPLIATMMTPDEQDALETLAILMRHGADLRQETTLSSDEKTEGITLAAATALGASILYNQPALEEILLAQGCHLTSIDFQTWACSRDEKPETLEKLCQLSPHILHQRDTQGNTLITLMLSQKTRPPQAQRTTELCAKLRLLLNAGINPNSTNNEHLSAFQLAVSIQGEQRKPKDTCDIMDTLLSASRYPISAANKAYIRSLNVPDLTKMLDEKEEQERKQEQKRQETAQAAEPLLTPLREGLQELKHLAEEL